MRTKTLLFSLLLFSSFVFSQNTKVNIFKEKHLKQSKKDKKITFKGNEKPMGLNTLNVTTASKSTLELGTEIGGSTYDLQTNKCNPNRVIQNNDGTISAAWTFAALADFTDRGTGYNYYDGTAWGANPTSKLESSRTGWPNILVSGGKEIVISHGVGGLKIISRIKGTGVWSNFQTILGSTAFGNGLAWPRAMSIGTNGVIGIASTGDNADTTIRFFKSNDGGNTFTFFVPEGLDSTIWAHNEGIGGDGYAMDVRDNVVAIVIGDMEKEVWLFKSLDGGNTFTRKKVFALPIPRWKTKGQGVAYNSDWNNDGTPDTLTTTDGRYSIVIDNDYNCHIVGGYMRLLRNNEAEADFFDWYPHTPGIWYWKEGQKTIFVHPNDGSINGGSAGKWNPNKFIDSSFTIVKKVPDLNNDGELNYLELTGDISKTFPFTGPTSMPHLAICDNGVMALSFSAINELSEHQGTNTPYRNLFLLTYYNGWNDTVINVTDDAFSEQIYSMGSNRITKESNCYYYTLMYQSDDYPGINLLSENGHPVNNNVIYTHKYNLSFYSCNCGFENLGKKIITISNYPNPFTETTTISVNLANKAKVNVVIKDLFGKTVLEIPNRNYGIGVHNIDIDASKLPKGMYIYTVNADNQSVSNKMIIE